MKNFFSGPHEEKEGASNGQTQVRREIQNWQEQMVLPEAQILNLYPEGLKSIFDSCETVCTPIYPSRR